VGIIQGVRCLLPVRVSGVRCPGFQATLQERGRIMSGDRSLSRLWVTTVVLAGAGLALCGRMLANTRVARAAARPQAPAPVTTEAQGVVRRFSEVKFAPDDDVKCLNGVVEKGDPATGPSTFILKAAPGCVVAPHYHTAEEQLMVVRG